MGATLSEIKAFIKISIFIKNIITKLPTFWMLKSLFGPFIGRKKVLYISLPSIYVKCPNGNAVQPYRKRGSMLGGVRTDLPWVRPHDGNAASYIKVLFSDFVEDIKIVPDEDVDDRMIRENLVCIGGQSNWVFEQFVINQNFLLPLEYRIDRNKGIDGFYNSETGQSYESQDSHYSYGLLAIVRNPQAYNKRIVFVSGLDADSTLEIARTLKDNLNKIYQKAKSVKLDGFVKSQELANLSFPRKRESSKYTQLWIPDQVGNDKTAKTLTFYELVKLIRSDFYCICCFKRTGDPKIPLIYDNVFISKISDNTSQ